MTTILCLASYFKGTAVLETLKREGAHVILVTREKLSGELWPWESIDEVFYMPSLSKQPDITYAVSYLARAREIDGIIPLDDYDVLTAADLREHMRLPGLGATAARYFRDKLAMRQGAARAGIRVPAFTPVLNHGALQAFMDRVPGPWVLKPRTEAGAMGIKKIRAQHELWPWLEQLGDQQSFFVLERFVPGDVYHVDSIVCGGEVVFAAAQKYAQPPMAVAHEGGVFVSRMLPRDGDEARAVTAMNEAVMHGLGMENGVAHTEFIRASADNEYLFLETAARVGGANIAEMVEAGTGINLWREWARLELALRRGQPYELPPSRQEYAGILVCLARQEYPDLDAYQDPEVVWRMHKRHHAGLIVAAPDPARVWDLLNAYAGRFATDFLAVAPPLDKAPE